MIDMRFHTVAKIGEKRSFTKEGYMLCEDVPLARLGEQVYAAGEIPITPNSEGYIRITRDSAALFNPATIASFNLKPFVIDHPEDDVEPSNWNSLTKGIIANPRRGTGRFNDCLVGDILITNPEAIHAVNVDGVREISLGYDADYEEIGPGVGRQHNIQGNHGALVKRGRCGTRCSIGDEAAEITTTQELRKMSKKNGFVEAIMAAFKTKDEAALATALETMDDEGDQHIHIHTAPTMGIPVRARTGDDLDTENVSTNDEEAPPWFKAHVESNNKRFDAIEAALKADKAPGASEVATNDDGDMTGADIEPDAVGKTLDKAAKFRDSAMLEDGFQETASLAEILSPGIRIPTYDRALVPKKTVDSLCKLRRASLDMAYMEPQARAIIDDLQGGKEFDIRTMDCASVRTLFKGAASAKKAANNASFRDGNGAVVRPVAAKGVMSIEDLNRLNAERYAQ